MLIKLKLKGALDVDFRKKVWIDIVQNLSNQNLTIATMESCTGGGIANEITNVSGASTVLRESYVTYCNEAKIKLGVSAETIKKYTVYSSQTAVEMAKAAKSHANSDIGIGVTGQLGRIDPSNPCDCVNNVWFAIINKDNKLTVKSLAVPSTERKAQKGIVISAIATALVDSLTSK